MTPQEFKAWFDGFSEGIDGIPTDSQWEKIRAKVKEINGTPIAPTVIREYVDRYHWYRPYWLSLGAGDVSPDWSRITCSAPAAVAYSAGTSKPVEGDAPAYDDLLHEMGRRDLATC